MNKWNYKIPEGLPGTLLFVGVVGSTSYNLNTPESDVDFKGVYIQNMRDYLLGNYVNTYSVTDDETYYELGYYLHLLKTNNPNIMELLYLREEFIVIDSPIWKSLLKIKDKFLTKKVKDTYTGYARTQIKKAKGLTKKVDWEKKHIDRKTVEDFCFVVDRESGMKQVFSEMKEDNYIYGLAKIDNYKDTYKLYRYSSFSSNPNVFNYKGVTSSNEANDVCVSEIPKEENNKWIGILFFNKQSYSHHCKDYKAYQKWLNSRNINRYTTNKDHGQVYDSKNMMHCVRLLRTVNEIGISGTINVYREKDRDELLDIKTGKTDLSKIHDKLENMLHEIDNTFEKCNLPDEFKYGDLTDDILLSARMNLIYK